MLFQRLWHDAMDKDERLRQLGSRAQTIAIEDSQAVFERLSGAIASAREEIIGVTGSGGLVGSFVIPFQELYQRGIRLRIMTTIDGASQKDTRELAKCYPIRGVNNTPLRIVLVDRQHLFQLKSAQGGQTAYPIPVHPDSVFYTDDPTYTDGFYMMLNELWDMSQDLSEICFEKSAIHTLTTR
jgi:sugar-specific transcriptional regulator TrmB